MTIIKPADGERMQYLLRVLDALEANRIDSEECTTRCTECGEDAVELSYADDSHTLGVWGEDVLIIIIGCEGYRFINPALVGHEQPNWDDWRQHVPAWARQHP